MPLSNRLANVVLHRPCPHCGHVLQRGGSWFHHIPRYKCEICYEEVQMTYDAKLALFEKYPTRA